MVTCISAGSPLTVRQLLKVCESVTDWYTLGIHLQLPLSQLNNIQVNVTYHVQGVNRHKAAMFEAWLKGSTNPSWSDLITALSTVSSDANLPTTGILAVMYSHCKRFLVQSLSH